MGDTPPKIRASPVVVGPGGGGPAGEVSVLRVFDVIAWMDGTSRVLGECSDLGR
jgi:hypothetical protein